MLALAKEKNVKTLIGLQAHQSAALRKVKEIIDSGRIGKVLSSTFHGTPTLFRSTVSESAAHSQDRDVGANLLSIYSMHGTKSYSIYKLRILTNCKALESIQYVLGPL